MKTFEIRFNDLTQQAKQRLAEVAEVEQLNDYDVLAYVDIEDSPEV